MGKPTVNEEYTNVSITPQQARLRDITYSAEISVDVEYSRGRVRSLGLKPKASLPCESRWLKSSPIALVAALQ